MNNNLNQGAGQFDPDRNNAMNRNGDAAIISGSDFYDHERDDSDSSSSSMDCSHDGGDGLGRNWDNGGVGLEKIVEEGRRAMCSDNNDDDFDGGGGFHFNRNYGGHSDDADDDEDGDEANKTRKYKMPNIDPLYNPNGDDEDEAYVYKHLRSGIEEKVTIRKTRSTVPEATNEDTSAQKQQKRESSSSTSTSSSNVNVSTTTMETKAQTDSSHSQQQQQQQQQQFLEQANILKPRNSDGILSCPCCFQIVCMDCQKHDKYSNQFRAMFVMNIGVDWNVTVTPDHIGKGGIKNTLDLVDSDDNNDSINTNIDQVSNKKTKPIPTDEEQVVHEASLKKGDEDVYYSVHCNNCQTQIAALDMRDEIYHFFGCIVSG